jgi:hypothetical protein
MLTSIVGEQIFLVQNDEDVFCWNSWRWALAARTRASMSRPRGTNSDGKVNRRAESVAARRGCRPRHPRLIAPPSLGRALEQPPNAARQRAAARIVDLVTLLTPFP